MEANEGKEMKCRVPYCQNETTRIPAACTKHFIEGWGRLPEMPLPEEEAPLYVSDKPPKLPKKRKGK
jgi:hypothetical protein